MPQKLIQFVVEIHGVREVVLNGRSIEYQNQDSVDEDAIRKLLTADQLFKIKCELGQVLAKVSDALTRVRVKDGELIEYETNKLRRSGRC